MSARHVTAVVDGFAFLAVLSLPYAFLLAVACLWGWS